MTLPERANYSLTESALSPFPAEPAQTSQRDALKSGTLVPPEGLELFVGKRLSSSLQAIVQVSDSEQQRSLLKVNGESAPRASLRDRLEQFFQNRNPRVVQIEADGRLPFADVVNLIDVCRSTGAKVVLAIPAAL